MKVYVATVTLRKGASEYRKGPIIQLTECSGVFDASPTAEEMVRYLRRQQGTSGLINAIENDPWPDEQDYVGRYYRIEVDERFLFQTGR